MPFFGRRSRTLVDAEGAYEHSGSPSPELEEVRSEVELAQRELDAVRVEWEESSRELEEARTSMRRTQEEWLETSRMQMESFEEVNQRLFKKTLKRFAKDVDRYAGLRDRLLDKFERSAQGEVIFGDLAESQIEMMDARNRIMRRIGEVQFLWNVAGLDGSPEVLADGFDLVEELDEGIETLADVVRAS